MAMTAINDQEFSNRRVGYAHHVGHSPTYICFLLARLRG
jgi:hypothetical protein